MQFNREKLLIYYKTLALAIKIEKGFAFALKPFQSSGVLLGVPKKWQQL